MNSSGDGSKDGGLKRQNVSVAGVEEALNRIDQSIDRHISKSLCFADKGCIYNLHPLKKVPCMLQFKGLLVPELKCKYLTLELYMKNFDLYGVAGLLGASPHVETLNIDMKENLLARYFCNFDEDIVDLQRWISSFVFPNLKTVKIVEECNDFEEVFYHIKEKKVQEMFYGL